MEIPQLIEKSQWLRQQVFELVMQARKGHYPSSASCAEMILALFYGGYVNLNPNNLNDPARDRVLVSKGHAAMVLYPILADLGIIPEEELSRFCHKDSYLRMYADFTIPGVEAITGSLGHGLGIASGFCLSAKKDGNTSRSFVILGDGECYEGSIWETAMFAAHHKLDNLVTVVDRNKLCIIDETENCLALGDLKAKWESFGWRTFEVDGHSYSEIIPVLEKIKESTGQPIAIIANTVKGKGISFMENQSLWHNRIPDEEQAAMARKELLENCIKH